MTALDDFDLYATDRPSRYSEYRARHKDYRQRELTRKRTTRATTLPEFIGVDSEGIGRGMKHRAVLLGVGDQHYIARDMAKGLQWDEVFEFLYSCFEKNPKAVYVGFFLGYDFNQWLKSLPLKAARSLLTRRGRVKREKKDNRGYWPVREGNWEFDTLAFKRLSIRPRDSSKPWMHICDAGPFFQVSFVDVLNPDNWLNDPDGPPCNDKDYNRIITWKNKRSQFSRITPGMIAYNAEENRLLAVCMTRLAKGFLNVGIRLDKGQWYGPGASSKKWLAHKNAPLHKELSGLGMPDWFNDACLKSYFGGWFEIFSHGYIGGFKSRHWNYDINNAYPYAATKLPHLCEDCSYGWGTGIYTGRSDFVLLYATVSACNNRIGPVPYRNSKGNILRPAISRGWYWKFEIDAAQRARLVKEVETHEWVEFTPCDHERPFTDIRILYDLRVSVGKNSAQGMAIKLNNNSIYGNFAQKLGTAPYNNWFYASYITAHCRTQILDAIATHPGGPQSVLMVATDGVCFDDRHPVLATSKRLGEWEETKYQDLFLFKPGVYWHKAGEKALLKVKSRGVPKEEFLANTELAHGKFLLFGDYLSSNLYTSPKVYEKYPDDVNHYLEENDWPWFLVHVNFRMKSCKQALNERKWASAGEVLEKFPVLQSSDPSSKRRNPFYNYRKQRIDTIIHIGDVEKPETYYHGDIDIHHMPDLGYDLNGWQALATAKEPYQIARDKTFEEEEE